MSTSPELEYPDDDLNQNTETILSQDDRLRRVIHAVLAIYLLPALVVVVALGTMMVVVAGAVNTVSRFVAVVNQSLTRTPVTPSRPQISRPIIPEVVLRSGRSKGRRQIMHDSRRPDRA